MGVFPEKNAQLKEPVEGSHDLSSEAEERQDNNTVEVPTRPEDPSDTDMHDRQLQQIEDEQKQVPLVGEKIPFGFVVNLYSEESSPNFYIKAQELAQHYSEIRIIRGDGNCFFRAILVAIAEIIMKSDEEARKFLAVCEGWVERLLKLGFPDWTTTDFCDYLITWVKEIVEKKVPLDEVIPRLNDDSHSNYLLIFFRLVASGYLKEHTDDYEPFIDNGQTLADYCSSEIEAMWKDVDHLAITGLVHALERPIRIEYMDRSMAPDGGWHYDFPPEPVGEPEIVLLYRPGHYDLIYRKPVN